MGKRISVLGAGRMGSALAAAFIEAGHSVTVWNRTAARCAPLAAAGATVANSVAEAAAGADLVIGNLSDYAVTERLLGDEEAKALSGGVFVQLASGTPSHARRSAAWAEERGIPYLDGAIMATPGFIGQPGCTILYCGPDSLFEASRPALSALGGNSIHVGADIGHANALDNAILVVLWGSLYGLLQGAALCEAERFPLDAFATSLRDTMPVIDASLGEALARIQKRHFAADETSSATVETCHASIRYLLEMAGEHRLDAGLMQAFDRLFQRAAAAGRAKDDFAALYLSMR